MSTDKEAEDWRKRMFPDGVPEMSADDLMHYLRSLGIPTPEMTMEENEWKALAAKVKAAYERGGPVAGHDFKEEWMERTGQKSRRR